MSCEKMKLSGNSGVDRPNVAYSPLEGEPESPKRIPIRSPIVVCVTAVVCLCIIAGIIVGLFVGLNTKEDSSQLDPPNPQEPLPPSPSLVGHFWDAAVTSNGYPCARIGRDILMKNGSAVDAAIATLFCDGVACPQSMGIGGGFLMTIYTREDRTAITLNARETAPARATEDMYQGNSNISQRGGLAVAVPGELRGYWEAHKKFGVLNWTELIEPTIKLCREGIEVSAYLARSLQSYKDMIMKSDTIREIMTHPETGELLKAGEKMKRLKLAETLEIIAEKGGDELYTGELAKQLVSDIKNFGGIIDEQDLANYSVRWEAPISAKLRDNMTLHTVPPPGSGVLLTFMMSLLDDLVPAKDPVTTYQRITEAFKYSYGKRTELGDRHYVDIENIIKNLTSEDYIQKIQQQISDVRTWNDPEHYGAVYVQPEDHGTAHVSVLAPNGDAVSVTSTVNLILGAMIRSPSTGIILNDEMDDFSAPNIINYFGVPPSPANFIAPGKRPLSSMCPAIIVNGNGDVRLVVGAAGGTKITTATALVSLFNLWFNMTIKEAVDESRVHHQLFPMELQYEYGLLDSYVKGLEEIGHKTSRFKPGGSAVTVVAKVDDLISANSDFRRGGMIAGF